MPRHIPLAEVRRLHQQHHLFAMLSAWCRKTFLIFCEIKHWHVMYVYAPPACLQLRSRVVAPSKHHGTPCPNISFHFHKLQQSPSKQFRTYKLHHHDIFLFNHFPRRMRERHHAILKSFANLAKAEFYPNTNIQRLCNYIGGPLEESMKICTYMTL